MQNIEDLSYFMSVFEGLTEADLSEMATFVKTRSLTAGECYIETGSASQKLAFIKKGLIRTYNLRENGDEITLMIRWENQFIASVDSVFFKRPSRFNYQALEDTQLLEVDYHIAQTIIAGNLKFSGLRYEFMIHMLTQAMSRIENFVLLSPEERYCKLLAEKPDIINRVPGKYIATMLGITPVSLSRIRKRIVLGKAR